MSSKMAIDQSLDSIIADKKKNRTKGGNNGPRRSNPNSSKAKLLGKGGMPAVAANKRKAAAAGGGTGPSTAGAGPVGGASSASMAVKIIISNLPVDVNEAQIKDLFQSTVGPTKTCSLNYNATGKSSGVATVVFQKQGDAQKAFDTYNNRLIDGKRAMKIEIVYDPTKQPLVNRVAAPKAAAAPSTAAAAGSGGAPPRRGAGRGRGRGRGGRGAHGGGKRPQKTAEDLDAEMADYTKEATTAATTA